jgi:hypothetical protein
MGPRSSMGSPGYDRRQMLFFSGIFAKKKSLTNDVHDTAEAARSDGDHDRGSSVNDLLATDETLGT